ncbi:hypothetical protein [Paenibacillus sp. 1781tsa1]|uniref:hypothetical protein n=1 Tax=Paenibacillus sp. 1781tsa1 TaxID=2953810 RepID=UPI0020A08202|nr:hypothetical protein [Paenibacillus sp. 1781tsa1]MCP1182734.1 hypothetical protein [Paenibacillus sp. 1781tsa1]
MKRISGTIRLVLGTTIGLGILYGTGVSTALLNVAASSLNRINNPWISVLLLAVCSFVILYPSLAYMKRTFGAMNRMNAEWLSIQKKHMECCQVSEAEHCEAYNAEVTELRQRYQTLSSSRILKVLLVQVILFGAFLGIASRIRQSETGERTWDALPWSISWLLTLIVLVSMIWIMRGWLIKLWHRGKWVAIAISLVLITICLKLSFAEQLYLLLWFALQMLYDYYAAFRGRHMA